MKPSEVAARIGNCPYMGLTMGEIVTHHIRTLGLKRVLEFGHAHGASTCYFAAAAESIGGSVITIDLEHTKDLQPNVEGLLDLCGLRDSVEIVRQNWVEGGEWRLLKLIEAGVKFDFAYIDAGHDWLHAAANFIMIDQLIRPGGWILFDDIAWTVDLANNRQSKWCEKWTDEMKARYQVRDVWRYIVQKHPSYFNFVEPIPNWGLCQKKP